MTLAHITKAVFVFVLQLLCVAGTHWWKDAELHWLPRMCSIGIYLIPLVGYAVVLRKAPMWADTPVFLKLGYLVLVSFAATVAGMMMALVLFAVTGMLA